MYNKGLYIKHIDIMFLMNMSFLKGFSAAGFSLYLLSLHQE